MYVIPRSSPSTAAAQLRFLVVGPDDPLAQPLLAELAVEYSQRYGGTPEAHLGWLPVPSAELAPPSYCYSRTDCRRRKRAGWV